MWIDFDWMQLASWLPIMAISGGFQKSGSSSDQMSEQGLSRGNRENLAQPFYQALRPGGVSDFMVNRLLGPQPNLPGLSRFGLYEPQQAAYDQGFQQAVTQALNKFSGNFAQRGFLNPENINAIAGSAAMNVAPQFAAMAIPTAGQNIVSGVTIPEDIFTSRAQTLRDFQALLAQLITGGSTSAGTSRSSSFGAQASYGMLGKP